MEAVDILWHVLAAVAFVGVVLHLNRRLGEFAERDRLAWTMLLGAPSPNGQNLPAARLQSLCAQVLRLCEKDISKRFAVKKLTITTPESIEATHVNQLFRPLWALVMSPRRDLDFLDYSATTVRLNQQNVSLAAVAAALVNAHFVNLSWQEGQWHFEIS